MRESAGVDEVSGALFRTTALGTTAEVLVTDRHHLVRAVRILRDELDWIDRLASRFRADSEISQLHQANGRAVRVSPDLIDIIRSALSMAEATDGAVDPTVGAALCRLGYDRDFADIAAGIPGRLPQPAPVPGWAAVAVDIPRGTVRLPRGTVLDLGATAKALTADRAVARIASALGCGVLISLGGDVAVAGPPPPGGFPIGLSDACTAAGSDETVAIDSGGLATSGVALRQWRLGSHAVHHIVDPATGLPAATPWRTVSVAAATCVEANAAATAAMVKGAGALGWLSARALPARLVGIDGALRCVARWPAADRGRLEPRDRIR